MLIEKRFYNVEKQERDYDTDEIIEQDTTQYNDLSRALQSWTYLCEYRNKWTHGKITEFRYYSDGSLDSEVLDNKSFD